MAFNEANGLTVESAMQTVFLDTMHYDAECSFPPGFEILNKIVITNVGGLRPFVIKAGKLETPEFTVEAIVTIEQELRLRDLFVATVRPGYIDLRYPITFMWGNSNRKYDKTADNSTQIKCYLSEYEPPDSVDYTNAEILEVKLTLRAI